MAKQPVVEAQKDKVKPGSGEAVGSGGGGCCS
jgi:hypothetical protein